MNDIYWPKKVTECKMRVLIFSTNLSGIFIFIRLYLARYTHKFTWVST
jgi:hypothetical protein